MGDLTVAIMKPIADSEVGPSVWCWFHEFSHPFDGVSDGWMCHTWGPNGLPPQPTNRRR